MIASVHEPRLRPMGVRLAGADRAVKERFLSKLEELRLDNWLAVPEDCAGGETCFRMREELADAWLPWSDTTQLSFDLDLNPINKPLDLEREILLTMLAGPVAYCYPSFAELTAAVRMRCHIVAAARRTQLAFCTDAADRPTEYWTYAEDRGFTVLPRKPLIAALEAATQPDGSGRLYSFSCYRATEYVLLLGIARELATLNPPLLQQLQGQWEERAIMSGKFHDVFLREYGSMEKPLPAGYYVPGDRVWFRNPDERSSDVPGYEGSWVFYLGGGQFSNFWKPGEPYTLTTKCVEMYHWRHGVYRDRSGELRMDETLVESRVRNSLADPEEVGWMLRRMARVRDPKGVYADGGCIDASREFPRWVCPGTADIQLPGA